MSALLAGEVRLRHVIESDLAIFFEHQREPEANQMAAFPPRGEEAFMAHWAKILDDESCVIKAILCGEQVAGNIGSWQQDGTRLVGYWIGKAHWGKGVASRALAAFVDAVKTRPLHAFVAKHNFASIRVLEKCGFALSAEETSALEAPSDGVEELVFKLGSGAVD